MYNSLQVKRQNIIYLRIDDEELSKVSVYPNPTGGRVHISGLNSETNVNVYSVEGKLLKHYNTVSNYIDLELPSGLYLLKLISDKRSIIKKIIVE